MTLSYWFVDPWLLGFGGLIGCCFLVVLLVCWCVDLAGFSRIIDYFDSFDIWGRVVGFIKAFCSWLEDTLILWFFTGVYVVMCWAFGGILSQCFIIPLLKVFQ